jgi:hypothetical protein
MPRRGRNDDGSSGQEDCVQPGDRPSGVARVVGEERAEGCDADGNPELPEGVVHA